MGSDGSYNGITANVKGTFVKMSNKSNNADTYLEIALVADRFRQAHICKYKADLLRMTGPIIHSQMTIHLDPMQHHSHHGIK